MVRAHGVRAKSGAGDCGSNPCPAATLNGFGDLKKKKRLFYFLFFSAPPLSPPLFHLHLSLPSPPSPLNPPFISQSLLSLPLMLFDCCAVYLFYRPRNFCMLVRVSQSTLFEPQVSTLAVTPFVWCIAPDTLLFPQLSLFLWCDPHTPRWDLNPCLYRNLVRNQRVFSHYRHHGFHTESCRLGHFVGFNDSNLT